MKLKDFVQMHKLAGERCTSSKKTYKSSTIKKQWIEFSKPVEGCDKALLSLSAAKAKALGDFDIKLITLDEGEQIWAVRKAASCKREALVL